MNYRKWIVGLLVIMLCLPVWTPGVRAAAVQITIELDGETLNRMCRLILHVLMLQWCLLGWLARDWVPV